MSTQHQIATGPTGIPVTEPFESGTAEGTWAVVVSSLSVLATTIASGILFKGFLDLAALPGPTPALDQVPETAATAGPMAWMAAGTWAYALAGILALIGLVGGVRYVRSPRGYSRGVWAIALAVCTPILAIMLLAGMGAT